GYIESRTDGRIDSALQPRSGLAVRSNCGLHVHRGDGVKIIEANIVFAAPDNFDGLAELFGKDGSFRNLIRFRLASEGAAEQRDVAGHSFFLNTEHAGDGL